jgi:hypothetical protein
MGERAIRTSRTSSTSSPPYTGPARATATSFWDLSAAPMSRISIRELSSARSPQIDRTCGYGSPKRS